MIFDSKRHIVTKADIIHTAAGQDLAILIRHIEIKGFLLEVI